MRDSPRANLGFAAKMFIWCRKRNDFKAIGAVNGQNHSHCIPRTCYSGMNGLLRPPPDKVWSSRAPLLGVSSWFPGQYSSFQYWNLTGYTWLNRLFSTWSPWFWGISLDTSTWHTVIIDPQTSSSSCSKLCLSSSSSSSSSTIINHHQPSSTIINHHLPSSTIINHHQPSLTIINHH